MALRQSRYVRRAAATGSVVAMLAAAGCGGSDSGGGNEYKLASYLGGNLAITQAVDVWADEFQDSGDVTIDRYYEGSLYAAEAIRDALSDGTITFGQFAPAYHPDDFPLTEGLLAVPFTTSNAPAVAETIMEMYEKNPQVKAEYEDQGLHLLAVTPTPPAIIGVRDGVPETPADLEGMQIRAVGSMVPPLTEVGAEAVGMPAPDTYQALQTGVLDGFTSLPLDIGTGLALQEVTKTWVDPGVGVYAAVVLAASLEEWNQLPEDVQKAAEDAADQITDQLVEKLQETETTACDTLKEAGVEVTAFEESDVEQWKNDVGAGPQEAWAEKAEAVGADADAIWEEYTSTLAKWETEYSDYAPGMVACVAGQ